MSLNAEPELVLQLRLLAAQAASVLMHDLGYRRDLRPLYGHAPLRHQLLWRLTAEALGDAALDAQLAFCESHPEDHGDAEDLTDRTAQHEVHNLRVRLAERDAKLERQARELVRLNRSRESLRDLVDELSGYVRPEKRREERPTDPRPEPEKKTPCPPPK